MSIIRGFGELSMQCRLKSVTGYVFFPTCFILTEKNCSFFAKKKLDDIYLFSKKGYKPEKKDTLLRSYFSTANSFST